MKGYINKLICKVFDRFYIICLMSLDTEKAIPLSYWIKARKALSAFASTKDPLFNKRGNEVSVGSDVDFLPQGFLQENEIIGGWTMSKDVMGFILKRLLHEKPQVIIECGSGISTILLAYYASLAAVEGINVSIVSLEQDEKEAERSMERLRCLNLDKYAAIIYTPIDASGIYQIDMDSILTANGNRPADCLLIDGPCGPEGCRIDTLTSLSSCCTDNARWFLDDALRDGELNALIYWDGLKEIKVEGIYPFSKGLGVGRLNCWRGGE